MVKQCFGAALIPSIACLVRAQEPRNATLLPPIGDLSVGEDAAAKDKSKDPGKDKPKPPDKEKKITDPPAMDIFSSAPLMGSQFPTGFNPQMMGDFSGGFVRQTITIVSVQTITTTTIDSELGPVTTTRTVPTTQTRTVLIPIFAGAGVKIAENESPMPIDRVFFTYNFYGNLRGANQATAPSQTTTTDVNGPTTTTVTTNIPGTPPITSNLHREIFGFEKTFLGGFASIELRLPLVQQLADVEGFSARGVGDLTILGKYAFLLNRDVGDVLSAGLAVTVPTGRSILTIDGNVHATLVQPWFGYIWNFDRFYIQAFHSVVIPTDSRDVALLFNDVGVNFWLYRGGPNRLARFVVATAEFHLALRSIIATRAGRSSSPIWPCSRAAFTSACSAMPR
ncbi:MAG: hypothetical protein HYR84_03315 [Planctomycetes bacterium]|nr:hypothetical protein [Planctomycetota bacterium]